MSSIVNKSGTRFTPKVRQRRPASAAPTQPHSTTTSAGKPSEPQPTRADTSEEGGDGDEPAGPKDPSLVEDDDPLSHTQLTKDLKASQMSTQLPVATMSPQPEAHGRSSRLDSLSHQVSVFKSGFLEQPGAPIPVSDAQRSRRLSTMSNLQTKKQRPPAIPEADVSLQAIKKRRMSARSSTSRKSGSAQRISVVPRAAASESYVVPPAGAPLKKESADDLFQTTASFYERYTISTLKEIPKNIADEDSARYTVNEDSITMADLCKPLFPIGEVSDNFHRAKEAAKAKMEARKKRRELRQMAKRQFKPLSELSAEEQEKLKQERKNAAEALLNAEIPDEMPQQTIQLKLQSDGKLGIDEESTVVDRHKNASYGNAHKERLDSNPFENLCNSSTYGRQKYTDPWTTDELIRFYQALSMWGTDFNLIAQLFPYRTRRQIKAKFVNEERKHPVVIELALKSKLPPDFEQYCKTIKKEIGTIEEFNNKLEQLQVEHEQYLKQIEIEKQNAREQDLQHQTSKEKERGSEKRFSSRQEQLKAYRKSEIVLGTIDDVKRKRAEELEAAAEQ
ncbi:ADL219Cp [Eremothecium gossypii ATCC 10895]|uniref:ADL219Cp n=1 Tax=Eremothecium gossypii (strain ATCC 10895 / CBS 109.51 / FGSC 9923 / NRRL Y-1056) TaxID=284811 RepID=Q75AY9_EREGS|nr:ADL219Cp [Eremothecium gossypii ATCC 10895]AAS51701.1 ADL219Cp [Eremothecium gossypii ATCC 10895]AEY95998.1 FADL219Cp [Eremothecium gossypii FDAG1]